MNIYQLRLPDQGLTLPAREGETVLEALQAAGVAIDAPCGGQGRCGKCTVRLDGAPALACQAAVKRDMTVELPRSQPMEILTQGLSRTVQADGADACVLAFDVGTTTIAAYLLDGRTGRQLARASALNPQTRFGADVISRIQYAMSSGGEALQSCVREALSALTLETAAAAGVDPQTITRAAIVGNTAMHHLLLGIDPAPLTVPPYMPAVFQGLELPAGELLPAAPNSALRILPNIAGFVGGDTVACMTALEFDRRPELSLLVDIGTNGEMVLGSRERRIACSTAAGPAFEGAGISCGMRGVPGAVDHVTPGREGLCWHTIGDVPPVGLCGSGLLDLVAALLETGALTGSGRLVHEDSCRLGDSPVVLTQKDVREVQLAKAAIRAGIELLLERFGATPGDVETVFLAGAFGNYLDPAAACAIGMFPPCLLDRIRPVGNAAGEGAKLCALSRGEYARSQALAAETEFLELASCPDFQDRYVDALAFGEEE